jgi:hypothetical protein
MADSPTLIVLTDKAFEKATDGSMGAAEKKAQKQVAQDLVAKVLKSDREDVRDAFKTLMDAPQGGPLDGSRTKWLKASEVLSSQLATELFELPKDRQTTEVLVTASEVLGDMTKAEYNAITSELGVKPAPRHAVGQESISGAEQTSPAPRHAVGQESISGAEQGTPAPRHAVGQESISGAEQGTPAPRHAVGQESISGAEQGTPAPRHAVGQESISGAEQGRPAPGQAVGQNSATLMKLTDKEFDKATDGTMGADEKKTGKQVAQNLVASVIITLANKMLTNHTLAAYCTHGC